MAANTTIWLRAPSEVLAARTAGGGHRRAISDEERMRLRERREPSFEELSRFSVDTGSKTSGEVVDAILDLLETDTEATKNDR